MHCCLSILHGIIGQSYGLPCVISLYLGTLRMLPFCHRHHQGGGCITDYRCIYLPHLFDISLLLMTAWSVTWVTVFFIISSIFPANMTSARNPTLYPKGLVFLLYFHFEG